MSQWKLDRHLAICTFNPNPPGATNLAAQPPPLLTNPTGFGGGGYGPPLPQNYNNQNNFIYDPNIASNLLASQGPPSYPVASGAMNPTGFGGGGGGMGVPPAQNYNNQNNFGYGYSPDIGGSLPTDQGPPSYPQFENAPPAQAARYVDPNGCCCIQNTDWGHFVCDVHGDRDIRWKP